MTLALFIEAGKVNYMDEKIIGYCVKCKEKREMVDVKRVEIKPGRPAAKGTCPKCSTGMYRILPKGS